MTNNNQSQPSNKGINKLPLNLFWFNMLKLAGLLELIEWIWVGGVTFSDVFSHFKNDFYEMNCSVEA